MKKKKRKSWYEYLWIMSSIYLILGLFNILFAWLGLICFIIPLIISLSGGGKKYCNTYCGRGQLFSLLGNKFKLSRNKPIPKWLKSKEFRYGFLTFFMIMFGMMLLKTYLVFKGSQSLKEVLVVLWTFKVPFSFTNPTNTIDWITQFAFGFYSMMFTSTLLGFITMFLFRANSWCVYCPMGTMTQGISILKNK